MKPAIIWFRQDLRLGDNPALRLAIGSGRPLICLYILDDETPGDWKMGGASRWWLHQSLAALGKALARKGGHLVLRHGKADTVLPRLVRESGAEMVVWNRCTESFAVRRDKALTDTLVSAGVTVETCNGALLFEPWEVATKAGKPFRVFTPFWNAARNGAPPGKPRIAPRTVTFHKGIKSEKLTDWALLPTRPNWARHFDWTPGEAAAHRALSAFLDNIQDYATARDIPAKDGTSRLSPHLHWGEISPRQVWHAVRSHDHARSNGAQTFLKELGWREFCHQLLFHNPTLPGRPFDPRFAKFEWRDSDKDFRAWTRGMTGIPIVDAGMRQLWRTGWMHNRVRMIAASLLIKHLGINWTRGEAWFWDTLVDADLANNAANWQWVAGSGADAAPFFRIFNPVLQGQKFDPQGAYVRRFVPELRQVSDRFIHKPWEAPEPPTNYPAPIVDLAQGRGRPLRKFKALKR